jgi:hypothetical protein
MSAAATNATTEKWSHRSATRSTRRSPPIKALPRFPSCPAASGANCRTLIPYVTDRPGHDHRYAIDASKLATEIGNRCSVGFEAGLHETVRWYLDREDWWDDVTGGAYQTRIDKNYGWGRLWITRILVSNNAV